MVSNETMRDIWETAKLDELLDGMSRTAFLLRFTLVASRPRHHDRRHQQRGASARQPRRRGSGTAAGRCAQRGQAPPHCGRSRSGRVADASETRPAPGDGIPWWAPPELAHDRSTRRLQRHDHRRVPRPTADASVVASKERRCSCSTRRAHDRARSTPTPSSTSRTAGAT